MIVDIAICVIVALFSLVGLQRGLVKSVISLFGFIGALILAYVLMQPFVDFLEGFVKIKTVFESEIIIFDQSISSEIAVKIVCFSLLYILLLIAVKIIDSILSAIFKLPVLNVFDKFFGFLFGLLKGFLFVCIVYVLLLVFLNDNEIITSSKIMKDLAPINPVVILIK